MSDWVEMQNWDTPAPHAMVNEVIEAVEEEMSLGGDAGGVTLTAVNELHRLGLIAASGSKGQPNREQVADLLIRLGSQTRTFVFRNKALSDADAIIDLFESIKNEEDDE